MTEHDCVFAKCAWRLIPIMVLLYVINYFDRVNVGFAALTMNADLALSPAVFGLGAGVFFLGYFLFQVPANLILARVGARRWIFCILAAWGAISAANALVRGPASFYALRFLLGLAEAGFFPGMIFYLTLWFPRAYRARFIATFMIGIPLAVIIGGPLSGLILGMDGTLNLHGWQWLFLLEGVPAIPLAFAVLKLLPDSPNDAAWLSGEERRIILARLAAEGSALDRELWPALRDVRVLALGVAAFGITFGEYGISLWMPQIVKAMGFSNLSTGFVVGLPYAAAMAAMILWGRMSDARGERIWHVVLPSLLAAGGFLAASLAQSNLLVLVALAFATVGINAIMGPFWGLPSSFLGGTAAAGAIALIRAMGGLGGFLGPTVVGVLKQGTGGYEAGMATLAGGLVLAAIIVFLLGRAMEPRLLMIKPAI